MPRIAILSVAHIHARSFCEQLMKNTPEGGAYVIWDDQASRGQAYAEQYNSRFEPNLELVLGDSSIDGFIITAENTRHWPLLEKVLALGKPVMCEKPLGTTVQEISAISAMVKRFNTPLCSGYFMPFSGEGQAIREIVEKGELGKITHVAHRNAHHAAYGKWFDKPELAWFADKELAGGGALLDLGTHSVHYLRSLFGPVNKVWATVTNLSGNYAAVDDYGQIMLQFANGILGRVEAGWSQQAGPTGLEICASKATLFKSQNTMCITSPGAEPSIVNAAQPLPDRINRLLALIAGSIDEATWKADLACCLDAFSIMAATYRSAESGTWQSCDHATDL